jgi:hypothetical protein
MQSYLPGHTDVAIILTTPTGGNSLTKGKRLHISFSTGLSRGVSQSYPDLCYVFASNTFTTHNTALVRYRGNTTPEPSHHGNVLSLTT